MNWNFEILAGSVSEAETEVCAKVGRGELPAEIAAIISARLAAIPPAPPRLYSPWGDSVWESVNQRDIHILSSGSTVAAVAPGQLAQMGLSAQISVAYGDKRRQFIDGVELPSLPPLNPAASKVAYETTAPGIQ